MEQEFLKLKSQVDELLSWKKQKERQQISFPLDLASKVTLAAPYGEGEGDTTLTQTINLTGDAQSIAVPTAPVRTLILVVDNVRYEIPSLI